MAIVKRSTTAAPGYYIDVAVVAGDSITVFTTTLATVVSAAGCSDNAAGGSNTYTQQGSGAAYGGGVSVEIHVFTAVAKASETVRITFTGTGSHPALAVAVRSGTNQTAADLVRKVSTVLQCVFDAAEADGATAHTSSSVTAVAGDTVLSFWAHNYSDTITMAETDAVFMEEGEWSGDYPALAVYAKDNAPDGAIADHMTSSGNLKTGNVTLVLTPYVEAAGDYTVSGQVITFGTAPAKGAEITIDGVATGMPLLWPLN